MMAEIAATPPSAWERIELEGVSRIYRTPRILDQRITLHDSGCVNWVTSRGNPGQGRPASWVRDRVAVVGPPRQQQVEHMVGWR